MQIRTTLKGQLARSLPRELKDTPASAGLQIQLSYLDTRYAWTYVEVW